MQYAISAIKSVLPASLGGSAAQQTSAAAPAPFDFAIPSSQTHSSASAVSGKLLATLSGHDDRVWMVSWHPSGTMLASCSGDKTVRIWSRLRLTTEQAVDSEQDAAGGWKCISILSGEHRRTVRCVAWSPDGNRLACSSFDATVTIWRRVNSIDGSSNVFDMKLEAQLDGHENEVKCVAWALPDATKSARQLATCSRDKTVWIWEQAGAADEAETGREDEEETFECAGVLEGHSQDIKFVKWIPPACSCASSGSGHHRGGPSRPTKLVLSGGYDDTLKIWEENPNRQDDWHCTATLVHHTSTVWEAAVQPTSSSPAGQIRAHDDDEEDDSMPQQEEASLSAAPDLHRSAAPPLIVSCSDDRSVVVWAKRSTPPDAASPSASSSGSSYEVAGIRSDRTLYSIDWNGSLIAVGSGADNVVLLHLRDNRSESSHPIVIDVAGGIARAHDADVNSVRFAPSDPNLLATASDDGSIKLWRLS